MNLNEKIKSGCLCVGNTDEEFLGIKKTLEALKKEGYTRLIKCNDKFLGGAWNPYGHRKHIHIIATKSIEEFNGVFYDVSSDNSLNYIDWNYIGNINAVRNWTRNKTYTIRNDWTRWKN